MDRYDEIQDLLTAHGIDPEICGEYYGDYEKPSTLGKWWTPNARGRAEPCNDEVNKLLNEWKTLV